MGIISTRCESFNSPNGMHAPKKAVNKIIGTLMWF